MGALSVRSVLSVVRNSSHSEAGTVLPTTTPANRELHPYKAGLIQENSGCSARGAGAPISNRLGCATDGSLNQSRLEASAPFS